MHKIACFFAALMLIVQVNAQSQGKRDGTRFFGSRYSSFGMKDGNILVYELKNDSTGFKQIVTIKKYNNAVNLDYSIIPSDKSGSVTMTDNAVVKGQKYVALPSDSAAILTKEMLYWISKKNFVELYLVNESQMDLGNGLETFIRGNTSTRKINVNGTPYLVTLFNIANKNLEKRCTMSILTDQQNPLIVNMDTGKWSLALQEVR